ncbi:MAG: PSD1 domain-containing protein [Pirellulales bacterium]|nr:PSD1 domain-containing protein [Pirellulales bacterium]
MLFCCHRSLSATCLIAAVFLEFTASSHATEPTGAAASAGGGALVGEDAFSAEAIAHFEAKIRPLLAERCHRCHGPRNQEGGLRLDSRRSILEGGDTGPALVPGKPNESLLIDAVRYGELYQMPPKGRLPQAEVALLEEWVERGAPWPREEVARPHIAAAFDIDERRREHWAWRPLADVRVPADLPGSSVRTAVDAFLDAKRREAGLAAAPAAEKGSLLRRASFDLIGLPPTPAELAEFEADDSGEAFARVVDRLLASPHFGERWARHWLDLVRYCETLGHEFDYPVTGAWRYRDYVIRALNADLPYDQFVCEHLAGDLIDPPRRHPTEGYNESIIATAFWFMGEALHAPVDSRADYASRIDNQLDVMTKAFLGLTVACARCHDHKFDAISTKDYYALSGYLASSHQQDAMLDPGRRIEMAAKQLADLQQRGRDAFAAGLPTAGEQAAQFASHLLACRAANCVASEPARDEIAAQYGVSRQALERFATELAKPAASEPAHPLYAWGQLAPSHAGDEAFLTRRSVVEAAIRVRQEQAATIATDQFTFEDFDHGFGEWFASGWAFGESPTQCGDWRASDDGPQLLPAGVAHSGRYGDKLRGVIRSPKFTIEQPYIHYRLAGRKAKVRLVVDGYMMDKFTPLLFEGLSFGVDGAEPWQWHVQSVQKHLGHRAYIELIDDSDGYLAVDEIRFASSPAVAPGGVGVTPLVLADGADSAEKLAAGYGRALAAGVDDWRQGRVTAQSEFAQWAVSAGLVTLEDEARAAVGRLAQQAVAIDGDLPAPATVAAMADGSGDDQRVFIRGNYRTPGELAPRQYLEAIAGAHQPPPQRGSGRLELAQRMLSADDPLVARVMVNRLWQHLMGRGIVATVDNFGVLGERPTHPALLDYLAARFRTEGWSIKKLIREIMLSDAYQMASVDDPASQAQDPLNLLYHRQNVRRLEGEAIRDALLAASGRLDRTLHGPSVPVHLTPFMEGRGRPEQSGPLDGAGRRSIYLEVRRNFLAPFMTAFDAPAPASTVGARNTSNVPAQALAMMNDPLVLELCRTWGEHMSAEQHCSLEERIAKLYVVAYCRRPSQAELAAAASFIRDQAVDYGASIDDARPWADLCHVLVNVKEFVFVP